LSVGAIVNVASFRNPHVRTIFERGLWGFEERDRGRWNLLERGARGSRGFGGLCGRRLGKDA
jgi:hypothetical protein